MKRSPPQLKNMKPIMEGKKKLVDRFQILIKLGQFDDLISTKALQEAKE